MRKNTQHSREGNGDQIMATLHSLTINALRLDGIWSITEGIAAKLMTSRG
jgi:hypothetical protein